MNMQTKASFKKEFLAFRRTGKVFTIAAVIIGLAILYTTMTKGLSLFFDTMSSTYDELGMDVSGISETLGNSPSSSVVAAISAISSAGLIVYLIMINSYAGGEQKSRSVIIPRSTGLRSFSYIFPKFILYPLTALVLAIMGMFVSLGISSLIYETTDISVIEGLFAGALLGTHLMLYTCIHITIGTATGKAGMSATICIVASMLLPGIFAALGAENIYNPFTLNGLSASIVMKTIDDIQPGEIIATVAIALAIMIILYFLSLFIQNAKRVDNSGNEARL